MPFRTGAAVFGYHSHIACLHPPVDVKLLNDSVFRIFSNLIFNHTDRFEVLSISCEFLVGAGNQVAGQMGRLGHDNREESGCARS